MKDIIKGLIYCGLFAVPFLTLIVANTYFFPYITGKNFAFRIIVECVFALTLILGLLDRQYRPRFSWILVAFSALVVVMAIATALAEHVGTALWSNFERMDGYITLLHVYLYFVVIGIMFRSEKVWWYFLNTSVAVAAFVALKGLSQLTAANVRVDSTLGNAAYMAVYMLFHIFFLAYLFVKTKVVPYRAIYLLLGMMFVYVLLQTGTRGTALGLVSGSVSAVVYLLIFAKSQVRLRKVALSGIIALIVLFGGFYAIKDTEYIQSKQSLARIANINIGKDLEVRSIIWGMSIEGVKERPVFGWGNGNFNYVFNEQYDSRLYGQEQWFDRVHNIVFDWLIAGGIVGFAAYVAVFLSLFYYLVIKPWQGDETLTVLERMVFVGLIIGYVTHNLVVFDNIISYIFFATLIALIHSRYAKPMAAVESVVVPDLITKQILAPIIVVIGLVVVYFVNIPGMQTASGIIDAFRTADTAERLEEFKRVLEIDSFAKQEVVEQLAQQAIGVVQKQSGVTPELQTEFMNVTETELLKMVEEKPNDARLHVFLASYYRAIGAHDKAVAQLEIARALSPNKQAIIIQQGATVLAMSDFAKARDFFQAAYELDHTNDEAREYYFASLYYVNDAKAANVLLEDATEDFLNRIAQSSFVITSLGSVGAYDDLSRLYERRVVLNPEDPQNWASLAFGYYQLSSTSKLTEEKVRYTNKAIETLERGSQAVPSFAKTATCFTNNIKAGRSPEVGCMQ